MQAIRWFLRIIILTFERLFAPKGVERSLEEQEVIRQQTSRLSLYQFEACPFCVKVRFTLKRLSLPIATRDAKNNPEYKKELLEKGGQYQVPCLRIENESGAVQWLYESSAIIRYLEDRFSSKRTV